MNKIKIIGIATLGFLNVAAGMFAWTSIVGTTPDEASPRRAPVPLIAPKPSLAVFTPGEDVNTVTRPLFDKSRRPREFSDSGPTAASAGTGFQLLAVSIFDHSSAAFVTSSTTPDGKWLKDGDSFENWTLALIEPQQIKLRHDSDVIYVRFENKDEPQQPPQRDALDKMRATMRPPPGPAKVGNPAFGGNPQTKHPM